MHPLNKAFANILAAFGGVVCPILFFFGLNYIIGDADFSNGWAIGTATDIAVALLFAKFIFPKKHPAFSFLLFLAIIDDFIGLGIIAVFYPIMRLSDKANAPIDALEHDLKPVVDFGLFFSV